MFPTQWDNNSRYIGGYFLFGFWFAIAGVDESEQTEIFGGEVLAYEH